MGIQHYAGEPSVPVDGAVVTDAVRILQQSGQALSAYGIDFGVLRDGKTALVELNDGFSLGSYGLDDALYTDLIVTRWREMTRGAGSENMPHP